MTKPLHRSWTIALAFVVLGGGCAVRGTGEGTTLQAPPATARPSADDAARDAMLERAFAIAARFPDRPFLKDKAQLQEAVVQAFVDRGDLAKALAFAERSPYTWRRGESFAIVGQAMAARGDADGARRNAERALAEVARLEECPDWARARVSVAAAQAFLRIGDAARAGELAGTDDPALAAGFAASTVPTLPAGSLPAAADAFDGMIKTRNFDLARAGLDGYHALLARSADDPKLRARALAALDSGIAGLPMDLQVAYRLRTAERLDSLGRRADAVAEAERAAALFASTKFLAEDSAPIGATVAGALASMGCAQRARELLGRLESSYRASLDEIVDIRRARALRALAEAWARMGDADRAMRLYSEAIEAGTANPNSRPRADDLSATCVSLAASGLPVPDAVAARIDELASRLADPW